MSALSKNVVQDGFLNSVVDAAVLCQFAKEVVFGLNGFCDISFISSDKEFGVIYGNDSTIDSAGFKITKSGDLFFGSLMDCRKLSIVECHSFNSLFDALRAMKLELEKRDFNDFYLTVSTAIDRVAAFVGRRINILNALVDQKTQEGVFELSDKVTSVFGGVKIPSTSLQNTGEVIAINGDQTFNSTVVVSGVGRALKLKGFVVGFTRTSHFILPDLDLSRVPDMLHLNESHLMRVRDALIALLDESCVYVKEIDLPPVGGDLNSVNWF